jgi:hypothetical protein
MKEAPFGSFYGNPQDLRGLLDRKFLQMSNSHRFPNRWTQAPNRHRYHRFAFALHAPRFRARGGVCRLAVHPLFTDIDGLVDRHLVAGPVFAKLHQRAIDGDARQPRIET